MLLEQIMASAALQSDRDAFLDHLQAITNRFGPSTPPVCVLSMG